MNLERLRIFKILSETLSFTETAKICFVTQSAISQQMRILQEECEHPLIQRKNNKVALTPEGNALAIQITSAFLELENTWRAYSTKNIRSKIRVMGSYLHLQGHLLQHLKPENNLEFELSFGNSLQCQQALQNFTVDIAFFSQPLRDSDITTIKVNSHQMCLVANRQYAQKFNGTDINLADLDHNISQFLLWQKENTRNKEITNLKPTLCCHIPHVFSILEYIKIHPCAAVLPEELAIEAIKKKQLIKLFPTAHTRQVNIWMGIANQQKSIVVKKLFETWKKQLA